MSESNVRLRGSVSRVSPTFNPYPCSFKRLTAAHRHDQDDDKSRRWSTDAMASVTPRPSQQEEATDSSTAPTALKLTTETLSQIPEGNDVLEAGSASSKDGGFHEGQIRRPQEGEHLTIKHAAALTLSMLRCSDTKSRVATPVDTQPEILTGLQTYMKADPPAGIPADVRADIEPDYHPRTLATPIVEIDEEYTNEHVQEAYATAYQLRSPGVAQLEPGVADSMRREAAMDDALFRPNLWRMRSRAINRLRNEEGDARAVSRKPVRKRKRETKESD
jgi:hypothetical protein